MKFTTRAKVRKSDIGVYKHYYSQDKSYKVIEVNSQYSGRYWLSVVCLEHGEFTIGRHKTRKAAEAHCQKNAEINE